MITSQAHRICRSPLMLSLAIGCVSLWGGRVSWKRDYTIIRSADLIKNQADIYAKLYMLIWVHVHVYKTGFWE